MSTWPAVAGKSEFIVHANLGSWEQRSQHFCCNISSVSLPWASQSPLSKASKGFLSLMLHLFICSSRQKSGKCYKGAEIVSWQMALRSHFCFNYQSNLCCLKKSFFLWLLACSFSHTLRVSLISHWLISSLVIINLHAFFCESKGSTGLCKVSKPWGTNSSIIKLMQ